MAGIVDSGYAQNDDAWKAGMSKSYVSAISRKYKSDAKFRSRIGSRKDG